jgi:O-antigen/teichoic acid export membrane protein
MASIDTTQVAGENVRVGSAQGLSVGTVARDIATVGIGTALAAVFNVLLVFLIPRLVSVEDFGYWRLFLLYAGYAGLMHMGLGDGALLRWAGRPLEDFRHEVAPSLKFLVCQHLAIIIPGVAILFWLLPAPVNLVAAAVLAYSLIFNAAALLQFGLQSARIFRPVAIAIAAPPGLFVLAAFLWHLQRVPNFRNLILLYSVAWSGVLVYLWARVRTRNYASGRDYSAWKLGKVCIAAGWPIMLANGGFGLVQSADRLVVSSVLPIHQFAQYSLAASTMFVPVAAILAVSRVFFSHAAALEHDERARVYGQGAKFLLLAWSLTLPYYFGLEVFVRHFLPKYVAGLPVASVLMLGVGFLAGIQILQMSYSYLYGKQRQFLAITVGAFAMSLLVALLMALWAKSLTAVAAGEVAVLGAWWAVNEFFLRSVTGQNWRRWLLILTIGGVSMSGYGVILYLGISAVWRVLVYYVVVGSILLFFCRDEVRLCWTFIGNNRLGRYSVPTRSI